MRIRKVAETALTTSKVVNNLENGGAMDAPSIEAIKKILSGFCQYQENSSLTISPTIDVYATVEAAKGSWGYGGTEYGIKIDTPAGATLLKSNQIKTNGHDTLAVPCLISCLYYLPAGKTYKFTISNDGSTGGSKGQYIKAFTYPKIDL